MKLKTDLERQLPLLLALYGCVACLLILDKLVDVARNVSLAIILLVAVGALVVNWRKWSKLSNSTELNRFLWSFIPCLISSMIWSDCRRWFHIPSYVDLILTGLAVIALVVFVVVYKRKQRLVK